MKLFDAHTASVFVAVVEVVVLVATVLVKVTDDTGAVTVDVVVAVTVEVIRGAVVVWKNF